MKHLAALATLLSIAYAQDAAAPASTPGDAQPPAAVEPAPAVEEAARPYLEHALKHKEILQELADCLATVTDRETANAAAPKVHELARRMKEMHAAPGLPEGEPSEEIQERLAQLNEEIGWPALVENSIGKAMDLWNALPACQGSDKLQNAIRTFLELHLGEAEGE